MLPKSFNQLLSSNYSGATFNPNIEVYRYIR